jgi:hypothetical protein
MTIKDYYLDALYSEDTALAHYFHYLVAEQKVPLDDDVSILNTIQVDVGKVRELIQKNVLGIHKICIYSLKWMRRILSLSLQPAEKRQSHSI